MVIRVTGLDAATKERHDLLFREHDFWQYLKRFI